VFGRLLIPTGIMLWRVAALAILLKPVSTSKQTELPDALWLDMEPVAAPKHTKALTTVSPDDHSQVFSGWLWQGNGSLTLNVASYILSESSHFFVHSLERLLLADICLSRRAGDG